MRNFPVLPSIVDFDPVLPVLQALGVEDPASSTHADDALGLLIAMAAATPSQVDLDGPHAMLPAASGEATGSGNDLADAPNLKLGLVTLNLDSNSDTARPAWMAENPAELPSPFADSAADFGHSSIAAWPTTAGDTVSIDSVASAKGGPGGGGSGGGGGGGLLAEYRSGSQNGEAGYDIWIQFKGSGWTVELQQAFKNSSDYLTTVITDDIGGGGRIGKAIVDDLLVTAEVRAIDGTGGILGQAGPKSVWTSSELTASGQMQFDVADALASLGKGLWDDIVTHELMHVLGFGSLWNYGIDPLVSNDQYLGESAVEAYQAGHPGATHVPVEDEGGSGTAGSHWDEGALDNELMTGYINDDGDAATANDNYLSEFSVRSLADLGYAVTYQDYPYDGALIA